jgi:hypothetical protein
MASYFLISHPGFGRCGTGRNVDLLVAGDNLSSLGKEAPSSSGSFIIFLLIKRYLSNKIAVDELI